MAEQQRLNLIIGANVDQFNRALTKVQKDLGRFARSVESAGSVLTRAITIPLGLAGGAAIKTFAEFDKLEKGLEALSGVAGEGKRQMKGLLDVVKDARTTLSLQDAAKGSLQLQAIGFSADRAAETLRQLGIAATISGSSSDDVAEVARQFSQAAAKGKILQQELRIVLERIPALAGVIANEFKTVTAEGLRDAGVSADEFISRLTKAIQQNDRFQKVQGGLAKAFETFSIEVQIAASELGGAIAKSIDLQGKLQSLSNFVSKVSTAFGSLSAGTQRTIVYFGLIAAAVGPVLLGLGTLSRLLIVGADGFKSAISFGKILANAYLFLADKVYIAVAAFRALSIAQKATIIGLALTAITASIVLYQKYAAGVERVTLAQQTLNKINSEAADSVADVKTRVGLLVEEYKKEGVSLARRKEIISQLKGIDSEYFKGLDEGKTSVDEIKKATDSYIDTLVKRAEVEQAITELAKINTELTKVDERALSAKPSLYQSVGNALLSFGNASAFTARQLVTQSNNLAQNTTELQKSKDALLAFIDARKDYIQGDKPITTPISPTTPGAGVDRSPITLAPIGSADFLKSFAELNIRIFEEGRKTKERLADALGLKGVVEPTRAALGSVGIAAREAFNQYEIAINQAGKEFDIFNDKQQYLQAQLDATKNAMIALAAAGDMNSEQFLQLSENFTLLQGQLSTFNSQAEQLTAIQTGLRDAFIGTFEALGEQLAAGEASAVKFAFTFVNAILDAVNAVLKLIAVKAFEKAITTGGGFGAFLAPAIAIGAIAAIKGILGKANIPALAEGGLASAPAMVVVGDNPNARLDPEVISPLSKLKNLIGDGGDGAYIAEARISGQDLLILMKKAELAYNRVR